MIDKFRGKYFFLSNFCPVTFGIILDGVVYPTTEHAYQASKTNQQQSRAEIRDCGSAMLAKELGGLLKRYGLVREDWRDVKLQYMEEFLRQKFDYPNFKKKLLATGDEDVVESNYWHDNYWGICSCSECHRQEPQLNHLGKLLMKIRGDLKNE